MQTHEQKNNADQDAAHRRLLSAVVVLAIRDACQHPKEKRLGDLPRSALNFLFEDSDGYLTLLDIDPEQFRKRLVNMSYANGATGKYTSMSGFSSEDRRCFRINYQMWIQTKMINRVEVLNG